MVQSVTFPLQMPPALQPLAFAHCVRFSLMQEVETPLQKGPPEEELPPPPELLLEEEEEEEPPPEEELLEDEPPLELLAEVPLLLPELRPDDDPLLPLADEEPPLLEPLPLADEDPPLLALAPEEEPEPPLLEPALASFGTTQKLLMQVSPALHVPFM